MKNEVLGGGKNQPPQILDTGDLGKLSKAERELYGWAFDSLERVRFELGSNHDLETLSTKQYRGHAIDLLRHASFHVRRRCDTEDPTLKRLNDLLGSIRDKQYGEVLSIDELLDRAEKLIDDTLYEPYDTDIDFPPEEPLFMLGYAQHRNPSAEQEERIRQLQIQLSQRVIFLPGGKWKHNDAVIAFREEIRGRHQVHNWGDPIPAKGKI